MYQPIVSPADLKTKMYPEVQQLITRSDDSIATEAIDIAISQAKMYLNRYDLVALFGDATANVSATITDPYLNSMVKDIAVWQLLRLANPNIDMSVALTAYEKTIASLKDIQAGKANPQGWPYQDTTGETAPQGDQITASSNAKRNPYF